MTGAPWHDLTWVALAALVLAANRRGAAIDAARDSHPSSATLPTHLR